MSRVPPASPWQTVQRRATRFIVRRVLGTLTRANTTTPAVALTFDDGPHPVWTPRVAELLAAHGARGTFFMLGEAAARQPELVRQLAQAGHALGNHSYSHPSFPTLPSARRRGEIQAGAAALGPHGLKLFRPPYGHQTLASRWDAARLGYQVVTWDIVPIDWLDHPPAYMAERVAQRLRPGSVVLFHDALHDALDPRHADRSAMLEALRLVLAQFGQQYRFVTVPELTRLGRPQYEHWQLEGEPAWMGRLQPVESEPARPAGG